MVNNTHAIWSVFLLCVCVQFDEDLQTSTGREKEKEECIVFYSLMKNKKKHSSIARRRNNLLLRLLLFYWIAFSFSRSLVDEPARENEKGKKIAS